MDLDDGVLGPVDAHTIGTRVELDDPRVMAIIATLPKEATVRRAFLSELRPGQAEPIHVHSLYYSAFFNHSGLGIAHAPNGSVLLRFEMVAGQVLHFPTVPVTHYLEAPDGASYVAVEYSLPPGVSPPANP